MSSKNLMVLIITGAITAVIGFYVQQFVRATLR